MIILALDTSARLCSACLYDTESALPLGAHVEDIGRGHAERLFPVIETTLEKAGHAYDDLDRLAVCVGPGSFTGVRVGVAAARGLSLAMAIPLIGVSLFEALVQSVDRSQPLLSVLDARRDEIYAQFFPQDSQPQSPRVIAVGEAAKWADRENAALIGSGVLPMRMAFENIVGRLPVLGESADVDCLTIARIAAGKTPTSHQPVPLYLRAPDAKPQTGFALPRQGAGS